MGQLFPFESPLSARHKQTNHPESNRFQQSRCGYGQNPIICSALGGRDVPTPENFKCKPARPDTSSVMIMNGTKDPLNPFNGGAVKLFGLFRRGKVRSSRDSGLFFANLNNIASPPETNRTQVSGEVQVEQVLWHNDGEVEVELISNHGGGHVIPQPYWRSPRILGPSPRSQTDQL